MAIFASTTCSDLRRRLSPPGRPSDASDGRFRVVVSVEFAALPGMAVVLAVGAATDFATAYGATLLEAPRKAAEGVGIIGGGGGDITAVGVATGSAMPTDGADFARSRGGNDCGGFINAAPFCSAFPATAALHFVDAESKETGALSSAVSDCTLLPDESNEW